MHGNRLPLRLHVVTAWLCLTLGCAGLAHARELASDGGLKPEQVRNGLYLISGGGSNSLVRLSGNGMIVVDGKRSGTYPALRKQIRRLSDLPIRILILTDHEPERTGTNADFLAAGTEILAHANAKRNLAATGGGDPAALPGATYERAFTGRLGGVEVQLLHFDSAHTNGDSVVYFRDLKVIAVGALLAATPEPDVAAGGSLAGWSEALGEILKLDFDTVVPGTGPIATRADLAALKRKIDSLRASTGTPAEHDARDAVGLATPGGPGLADPDAPDPRSGAGSGRP